MNPLKAHLLKNTQSFLRDGWRNQLKRNGSFLCFRKIIDNIRIEVTAPDENAIMIFLYDTTKSKCRIQGKRSLKGMQDISAILAEARSVLSFYLEHSSSKEVM